MTESKATIAKQKQRRIKLAEIWGEHDPATIAIMLGFRDATSVKMVAYKMGLPRYTGPKAKPMTVPTIPNTEKPAAPPPITVETPPVANTAVNIMAAHRLKQIALKQDAKRSQSAAKRREAERRTARY